jgi:glutathionylspermidine synthase
MKTFKKIKEWKKSQKELMKLKREIEEDRENLKFMEEELIKNGWTWDFSGVLPELVKPNKSKLSKGKNEDH